MGQLRSVGSVGVDEVKLEASKLVSLAESGACCQATN